VEIAPGVEQAAHPTLFLMGQALCLLTQAREAVCFRTCAVQSVSLRLDFLRTMSLSATLGKAGSLDDE
jgi:hypothetical protein